jgi:cytochrome c biogenesis protein CcmG, thiol:disulfide interchange protein DsbE
VGRAAGTAAGETSGRRATFGYVTTQDDGASSGQGRPSAEPASAELPIAELPVAELPVAEPGAAEPGAAESGAAESGAGEPAAGAVPGRGLRRRARSVLLVVVALAGLAVIGVLTVAVADAGTGHGSHHQAPKGPVAAQPFTLAELGRAGRQVSLAGYAGRPVIVNFFASWCTPCRHETPLLAKFYAAHHGQVQVIGIDSNDTTAAALKFVQAEHVGYPVGADPLPAKTATSYGVLALPQTFFLNARHQIVRHIVGQVTARDLAAWAAQLR